MFTNFYTTLNGQRHIARSLEDGKKLVLTKSAFGKGILPSGTYPVSAENLVSKLGEMTFKVKEASDNEYKITTNFSNYINKKILPAFHLTEMGIYGKIQNSDGSTDVDYPEKLIFYGCCSEAEADYIPATLTEFIINWSVAVAGEATIESAINDSLVYASQSDMNALDKATFDGYHKSIGTQYSGPAGDYGIDVGKIEGRSVQNEEPTPDNPAAINSFGGEELIFRSHGFQLYDASKNGTISEGGVTITNNGDGSFTVSGSGALTSGMNRYYELTHEETVNLIKSGNLTLNAHGRVYPYFYVQLRYDSGNSNISIQGTDNDKSSKVSQDILNDPTSVLRVGFYGASGQAIVAGTVKPMLYQDGDGTWEHFKEPQSTIVAMPKRLRSLPNGVCDTYEDGVVTRRVGMLYLKGDDAETWNKSTSYDDTYYVRKPSDMKQGSVVMCDRYKYVSIEADRTQDKVVFTGGYINFKDSGFASAGEFKTWVASNPITVLYELEVPVLEALKIPTLPSWAPNTAVHCNTLGTPIEWRIKNGVSAKHLHDAGNITGILSLAQGGTEADNRIDAINNLLSLPYNTEPIADTPTEWAKLGSFVCYYTTGTSVINKPATHGTMIQIVAPMVNGAISGTTLQQIWLRQGYGDLYSRSGSSAGWNGSADIDGADAWKRNMNMYPVGSVYMTAENVNPSAHLGGTWELIDRHLAWKVYNFAETPDFVELSTNVEACTAFVTVEGHQATFRINVKTNIDYGDTDVLLLTFKFDALGFTGFPYTINPIIGSGGEAGLMATATLHYQTGEFKLIDINPKVDGATGKIGDTLSFAFASPISNVQVYSTHCNRFYWKRTK